MTTRALEALQGRVRGPVITAMDSGYDEARRVYNAMIDARPQAVVRCTTAQDVAAVVRYAGETGTELAVRGGGHSVPGFGTADGAVVADLTGMRSVTVDPDQRLGRAAGGATWGGFNDTTARHGLATTGGHRLHHRGRWAHPRRRHRLPLSRLRSVLRQSAFRAGRDGRRHAADRQRTRAPRPLLVATRRRRRQLRSRHRVHLPVAPGQRHLRRPDVLRALRCPGGPGLLPGC